MAQGPEKTTEKAWRCQIEKWGRKTAEIPWKYGTNKWDRKTVEMEVLNGNEVTQKVIE